ncbi:MAG: sel1 repeat family protein [Oxalobacter sp.]|nr:sel1 repeat family protein [Oxalobacter sp.]
MKKLWKIVLVGWLGCCLPVYAGEFCQTLKTCQRQAKAGSAVAQAEMGLRYQTGEGVRQNVEKALYWFKKAAKQGNPIGLEEVGTAYYRGDGVARNNQKAIEWWKQAAEKDKSSAMWWLGYIYSRENDGVTIDKKEACNWFKRSAELGGDQWVNGNNPSYYELAACYERGEGIAKDNAKAIYWFEKAKEHAGDEEIDEIEERLEKLRKAESQ